MEQNTRKEFLKTIFNELDYWCEQYKIANANNDRTEAERISNNIVALEKVYKIYK